MIGSGVVAIKLDATILGSKHIAPGNAMIANKTKSEADIYMSTD